MDTRRYQNFNQKLANNPNLKPEEKQKILAQQLAAIQTANTNYKTSADNFLKQINMLLATLDPSTAMQQCQQTIQTAIIDQSTLANDLMAQPGQMCDQLKSAYATFENAMSAAYTKIGINNT